MLSKVLYIASMSAFSQSFLEELQKLHKDFIWNGKKPKTKHSTLIADYHDGGYKDIDILSALNSLKIGRIKVLSGKENPSCEIHAERYRGSLFSLKPTCLLKLKLLMVISI